MLRLRCAVQGAGAVAALDAVGGATEDRKLEGDQNVGSGVKESFSITSEPPLVPIQDVLDERVELSAALELDASKLMELAGMSWDGIGVYGPIQDSGEAMEGGDSRCGEGDGRVVEDQGD